MQSMEITTLLEKNYVLYGQFVEKLAKHAKLQNRLWNFIRARVRSSIVFAHSQRRKVTKRFLEDSQESKIGRLPLERKGAILWCVKTERRSARSASGRSFKVNKSQRIPGFSERFMILISVANRETYL
jgi:hypothetical protein